MDDTKANATNVVLNTTQKARIERNRLKALTLKESKLIPHPTAKIAPEGAASAAKPWRDSGGGFLLEEPSAPAPLRAPPGPIVHVTLQPTCLECGVRFPTSYLYDTFDYPVCDECRDGEDRHSLITRTEAKSEYLLKDCDLDSRSPPLRYVVRKNPHNARWGSMRLYLHVQVEQRALVVWGSEDALLEERRRREDRRERTRRGQYARDLRTLRMRVRGSLYDRTTGDHQHEYGPETRAPDDTYTAQCTLCGHTQTYEKM